MFIIKHWWLDHFIKENGDELRLGWWTEKLDEAKKFETEDEAEHFGKKEEMKFVVCGVPHEFYVVDEDEEKAKQVMGS